MKKGSKVSAYMLLLLVLPFGLRAQHDPEKLFLAIKELSSSDPDKAESKVKSYIEMGVKDEKIIANTYYLLGRINYFKSRNYISNRYYQLAIRSSYAKKELSFAESCYNNIGVNYEMLDQLPEALEAYQKSLSLAEKLKDSVSIGQSWINLGLLNAKVRKYDRARAMLHKALDFFTARQDLLNMALCYQNLGYTCSEEQQHEEAIRYYYKCLFLTRKAGNQFEALNTIFNIGSNYLDLKRPESAENYLQEAFDIAAREDRQDIIAKVYIEWGENNIRQNEYAHAESNLRKALKLIETYQMVDLEHFAFTALIRLYAKSGNFSRYEEMTRKKKVRDLIRSKEETLARTDEAQALFEFQRNVQQIENQERNIVEKRTQTYVLISLSVFFSIVLTIVVVQHLKVRRYMRSLFETTAEKTMLQERHPETAQANRHYLQEVYQKVLHYLQHQHPHETDITAIGRSIGVHEEYVVQAMRMFGDYTQKIDFFKVFYIEELCLQMMEHGKKLSLKQAVEESPFSTSGELAQKFREVTGLKPQQFLNYCELRLRDKRKRNFSPQGFTANYH